MQHTIPDDLGSKLEHLAAGMNRDVDSLVREAIQTWVLSVEEQPKASRSTGRLPDPPTDDEGISPPVDLPRASPQSEQTRQTTPRLPDRLEL